MNIVYFGDQWDNLWRRRQQIAWRLAQKGAIDRTWYIEGPLTLTSLIKDWWGKADFDAHSRWRRVREQGLQFQTNGLQVLTPVTLLPKTANALGNQLNYQAYQLAVRRVAQANRNQQILLWLSKPMDLPWLDCFAAALVCYDSTERFWEFEDVAVPVRQRWQRQDEQLARRADVVFVQTEEHLREKQAQGANVFLMPNAVDTDRFDISANSPPPDLKDIPTPRIGYVGSINYRIDWDLVEHILGSLPQFNIVFIGNSGGDPHCDHLSRRYPNMHFLGPCPYEQVPAYLQGMDVCIIPFLATNLTVSQSPLKLFDYLAAGKPIVATNVGNEGELAEWVRIADDYGGFCQAIERAVAEDCPELQQSRRRVAAQNSWAVRVEQIWEIISKHLFEKAA